MGLPVTAAERAFVVGVAGVRNPGRQDEVHTTRAAAALEELNFEAVRTSGQSRRAAGNLRSMRAPVVNNEGAIDEQQGKGLRPIHNSHPRRKHAALSFVHGHSDRLDEVGAQRRDLLRFHQAFLKPELYSRSRW